MSVEDPDRPRRLRKAIVTSAVVSGVLGGLVFGVNWIDAALLHFGKSTPWLWDALFYSSNTTAVAFWIVFLLSYVIKVNLSPAALDWERRMRLAEEIFKREKAAGRGSRWT